MIIMMMVFVFVITLLSHSLEGAKMPKYSKMGVFVATFFHLQPIKTFKSTVHNFVNEMTASDRILLILEMLNNKVQEVISHK